MKPSKTSGRRVAKLFVRSLTPTGGRHPWQEKVVRRLDGLVAAGVLADYTVHIWGDRVVPESRVADSDRHYSVSDRLDILEEGNKRRRQSTGESPNVDLVTAPRGETDG